jgi:non-canonical purine NTP pyrophosphatase (RdgB/HAM1 family)
MDITLITKNPVKILAARSVFDNTPFTLITSDKEYPEIQAESSLEIARFTANLAVKDLNRPVVREDQSFFINALGIPGPYMKYIEEKVSAAKLAALINFLGDNTGYFEIATVLALPSGEVFDHVFKVSVKFKAKVSGETNDGWNSIICINDEQRSLSEYPESERVEVWNQGFKAVAQVLLEKFTENNN